MLDEIYAAQNPSSWNRAGKKIHTRKSIHRPDAPARQEEPGLSRLQASFSPSASAAPASGVAACFGPPLATPTMAGRSTRPPIW